MMNYNINLLGIDQSMKFKTALHAGLFGFHYGNIWLLHESERVLAKPAKMRKREGRK